jgi:putative serine protease PepD
MQEDVTDEKPYRRGPAPGRLWSGFELEGGARPEPPRAPLPPQPQRPEPEPEEPPARAPKGSTTRRAVMAGAISGLLATLAALAIAGALDGDDGATEAGALPPAVAASPGAQASTSAVGRIYAAASPAVAAVQTGGGAGTGFLIDGDGTLVTNAHVVEGSNTVRVRFGEDGSPIQARVVGRDEGTDLAVLKVASRSVQGIRPLGWGDSDKVGIGDLAVAIGNPLGLERTATAGIVSGLERTIQAPDGFQIDKVIQTDAPINPGNSGGPLLDRRGQVIGVNSQIATSGGGGGNIGIGFAVPSNTAKEIVPKLRTGQKIERPWLGVSTSLSPSGGAEVQEVTPGSPAERAGLGPGDVITRVDGKDVQGPDDIATAISARTPGDKVDVEVRRGPTAEPLDVTLGQRPEQAGGG